MAAAPTASGTFPVYLRYKVTTMSGTNPDGSKYSDPGIPWVSYFNGGDALHGFVRGSYGTPQSVGCVELPSRQCGSGLPPDPHRHAGHRQLSAGRKGGSGAQTGPKFHGHLQCGVLH